MAERVAGGPDFRLVLTLSTIAAVLAALLVIPYPFMGDQSLFAVFARMMGDGSQLYRDIWDVKQPGIFWFYLLTGAWNGFSASWIHVSEAVLWVGGAVAVSFAMRPHLDREWAAGLFPLFAPALYFGVANINELTQVEPLMTLLVVAVVLLMSPGPARRPHRSIIAGVVAGVIGVFKLLLLIIPLTVVAVALVIWMRRGSSFRSALADVVAPFAIGMALPLAAVALWLLVTGTFELVWFTWVEYPPQVLGLGARPLSRLVGSGWAFVVSFAPIGALAMYRVLNGARKGRELTWLAVAAILGGLVAVVAQLWWSYLFFVLVGPLALLAVQGAGDLAGVARLRAVGLVVVLVLSVPAVVWTVEKAVDASALVAGGSVHELRSGFRSYREPLEELAYVTVEEGQSVYVLGDPSIIYLSDTVQGAPVNGWSPEFWTEDLWHQVAEDLVAGDIDWLYIDDDARALGDERAPFFEEQIDTAFGLVVDTGSGRWMEPRHR